MRGDNQLTTLTQAFRLTHLHPAAPVMPAALAHRTLIFGSSATSRVDSARAHFCSHFFARASADYTVRPTRGADNLFLISRASFSAHSPYAHLDGHHQEGMHAKVKVLKPSPQTFLAGMHAQLRPIGGRSEPDFSRYNDEECESQLILVHAHGPDGAGACL